MNTSLRFLASVLILTIVTSSKAQTRLHISNDDPRWGEKVIITYLAPSAAATLGHDSIYAAAILSGSQLEHTIVQPMQWLHDSTFESHFTLPDSTYSVRIEICKPSDRMPEGISGFTCRTADGKPTPEYFFDSATSLDSALQSDINLYPKHYSSYVKYYEAAREWSDAGRIKVADSSWRPMVGSLIHQLIARRDSTPEWYLTLAELYLFSSQDSLQKITLVQAGASSMYGEIYNNVGFWSHFFAPVRIKSGDIIFPQEPARIIAPLVERNPHTCMATRWLDRESADSHMPVEIFHPTIDSWSTSLDVDVLYSIAASYAYPKSPVFDPGAALQWLDRAEKSIRTGAGFYSGENIYGGMGGLGRVLALKIKMLGQTGNIPVAENEAWAAMNIVRQSDKKGILEELGQVYLNAGRLEDAKRIYGQTLASGTGSLPPGFEELYKKTKKLHETKLDFQKRLIATYGKSSDLPAVKDFAYRTLDGDEGTLHKLRGKVVVLDFWFISCAGCVVEKQSLNQLVDSFQGDTNIVFLSIALNDISALRRYLQHTESKFKIVPDGKTICDELNIVGYPTHIIIGRDGKTLGYDLGGHTNSGELMRPRIMDALMAK